MHPIKRFLLIGLFGFGTVAGFAHGFAHIGACHAHRREAFEARVADVCTASAERVFEERHAAAAPAAPQTTITIAAPATLTVGATVPAAAPAAVLPAAAPAPAPEAAPAAEAVAAP